MLAFKVTRERIESGTFPSWAGPMKLCFNSLVDFANVPVLAPIGWWVVRDGDSIKVYSESKYRELY